MGAHAAPRGRRLFGPGAAVVLLGAAYGFAAGWLDRDAGASLSRAVTVGVASGALLALVTLIIGRRLALLPRIPRAGVAGACVGAAAAFLVGLSADGSTARALTAGLLLALATGLAVFALSAPRRR
jgi:hypothetical protein